MNATLITWVLCYLGVLTYFIIKARKISKDTTAANEEFSLGQFIKADLFDIVLSLILATAFLSSGSGSGLPGISVDFSTGLKSFITGIGISWGGVNLLLSTIGAGDKSRKKVRSTVDDKTGKRY